MDNQTIQLIQQKLLELQSAVDALNKNNFSARQDFNKYSDFTSRLKVPNYSTNPATCAVGELIENAGKLYICSATNTWTKVGTQT